MFALYISGRERKIIKCLLEAVQSITVKQLATELNVSERTIHRDLENVEELCHHHHLNLSRKTGQGLFITGQEKDKKNLQLILNNIKYTDFTPEEREAIILLTLLKTNEPIKLLHLASELKVTIATISHDLDQAEESLQRFHLSLERRRGYGVQIVGNETDKRSAISYLFSKYIDESSVITLLKENIQKQAQNQVKTISNRLLGLIHPEKIQIIEKEVEHIQHDLPYDLADNAYIGLVVHLALAIERLQQGDTIQFDLNTLKQMQQTKEYVIAAKLIHRLEESLNISMPENEIGYITMHLMGARLQIDHDYLIEDSNLDIAYQVKELIRYVNHEINRNLTTHPQLLNDLVAHLKPAIFRLKHQMNIKNPLLGKIKKDYPLLFDVIKNGANIAFPGIDFPDEEVGYLVLHFGSALLQSEETLSLSALVICSSGIGTAKMLATKLKQTFSEIKHVENKSLFELPEIHLEQYDLVVSTIPLKGVKRPYVLASPMLDQAEINKIEKIIRHQKINQPIQQMKQQKQPIETEDAIKNIENMKHYSTAILQLLDHFTLTQVKTKKTKAEILQEACQTLQNKDILEHADQVSEKLLKREKQGGLGIPETALALFHLRSQEIKSLSLTNYHLSHSVNVLGMEGKPMQATHVLLMLAPEEATPQALNVLSLLSSLLVQDETFLTTLQSSDELAMKQLLTNQLSQLIQQKRFE